MNLFGTKKTTTSGSTGNVLTNLDGGPLGGTSHPYAGTMRCRCPTPTRQRQLRRPGSAAPRSSPSMVAMAPGSSLRPAPAPYVNAHLGGS